MPELKFYTLDVFTDQPFGGNPLAVVFGGEELSSQQMQTIAREFNLSETVFVLPPEGKGDHRVRIFTPGSEMPFAGHPTIGTAILLALLGKTAGLDRVVLEENAGLVPVVYRWENGLPTHAELTSPTPPEFRKAEVSAAQVAEVLGVLEKHILDLEAVSCGAPYLLVRVKHHEDLQNIRFNVPLWEKHLQGCWAKNLYVFFGAQDCLYTRMFAPELGVLEDPATGSAAVTLAAHLGNRIVEDLDYTWVVHQGIEMGRPSRLEITAVKFEMEVTETRVGGSAVQMMEGTLRI
ncbi:PhzF family phenazine biosynthesis protein [Deinococcus misasensis]|uniref:PhzF family phenazine biosynthesis protein n=1 Tax=Deinococcus misasensis TaxID=392413 RepID=UPI00054E6404|nr:PhzF family phenazine biosynthesis protein [Deinococcus misasensis]